MRKKKIRIVMKLLCVLLIAFFVLPVIRTSALSQASDRISLSWPSAPSDHTLTFKTVDNIPAGGRIALIPQAGSYFIPMGFDYEDIDLAVSASLNGTYSDRDLAMLAGPAEDGVTVLASTTNGRIDIRLSDNQGISAGSFVRVELGQNADYGASSSEQFLNPDTVGSYMFSIETYDDSDKYLERAQTMAAIIVPVRAGNYVAKARFEGRPNGVLNYGTTETIMSLMTNYPAFCRWSDTASTTYYDMTNDFSFTGSFYHSGTIYVSTGGDYVYYIRCLDTEGVLDDTDYLISFRIAGFDGQGGDQDTEGTPGDEGSGPGSGGGSGGGEGGTVGEDSDGDETTAAGGLEENYPYPPIPGDPVVTFQGLAYPASTVILLKDGSEHKTVTADDRGAFTIDVVDLPQGVYTFSLVGEDRLGRKPAAQSYTFYVKEGTKTQLYDVFLPPTIETGVSAIEVGNDLGVSGQSAANADIELWLYPYVVGGVLESSVTKYSGKSGANGDWVFDIDTGKLLNGPYQLKAKSSIAGEGASGFSKIVELMVGGEAPVKNTCDGADLNGDGKVNITDFSILLYWWGKDNDCADQNNDGTVNLTDFSIMLYYWTG